MYDLGNLASNLSTYVEEGVLTAETADTILEAAENKNNMDDNMHDDMHDDMYDETSNIDLVNNFLDDRMMEARLDEIDSELEMYEVTGANAEYLNTYKELVSDYKDDMNKIKARVNKAYSSKKPIDSDFNEIENLLKRCRQRIDSIEKSANNIKPDMGDNILAAVGNTLKSGLVAAGVLGVINGISSKGGDGLININKKTVGSAVMYGALDTAIRAIDHGNAYSAKNTETGFNVFKRNILKAIQCERKELDNIESQLKKLRKNVEHEKIEDRYDETSNIDLVNEFLNDRIMEACAECDPAKNVENEITEKLPTINPNEPNEIGSMKEVEKTDKSIEDAKKDLSPAARIAELKAKHEAEKDSTEQHETIDQTTKLESVIDRVNRSKLDIYEAYDAGLINGDEKEVLLDMINIDM